MEQTGKINVYICKTCRHGTTTINACDGVTPFMIRCRKLGCDGMAESLFYRVPQNSWPSHEWYKPEGKELAALDQSTRDHVDKGGLILRRLDVARLEYYGFKLRHG